MIGLAGALAALILAAPADTPPPAAPATWTHDVSGLFRNLFTTSRSIVTSQRYGDNLDRLRFDVAGGRGYAFSYQLVLDSETHLGNRMGLPDFASVRDRQDAAWLDLGRALVDEAHVYSDLSVYRASVSLRSDTTAVTVGRQRIAWGTARFWSPADLFNPIDPLQVESDVRQGVDALQVERTIAGRWRTTAVYAPQRTRRRSTVAARLAGTVAGWDVAAFGGRFRRDWVGGGDAAGQWGGAGLRAELTYTWRADDGGSASPGNALRVAAGADYAWPKLYVIGEYFYNQGQPPCGSIATCAALAFEPMTELFTLHRHFGSGGATYTITPLLKAETYAVADLAGGSLFVNPILRYNAAANVDLAVGAQLFAGRRRGEFGGLPRLFFAELDVHF